MKICFQVFIDEVRDQIPDMDWARVHFLGRVPYDVFLSTIQVSRVHVYLTYPFVLSWSLLESMSAGAAIVAGDTAPVREVIEDGKTGLLTVFLTRIHWLIGLCAFLTIHLCVNSWVKPRVRMLSRNMT